MHLDHLPGSFFGPPNLVELLRHQAQHKARDLAFIYLCDGETDEVRMTYAEVDRHARAIAATLQERGLAGQRALLLYPAGLDFITAFFGCMYAGVIAVTAYPPRRNRNMNRIEAIANDADAKIALTTRESLERVTGFVGDNPKLVRIPWMATDELPISQADAWEAPGVHGDTLALLQYTSGSTGTPKGVMLSHANLMHNSAMISYAFEHTRSGSGVFWLPSYHDMGLIGGILQPLYAGQSNVIFSPAAFLQKPFRWLQAISHYGATISGGPNFAYDLAVDKISDQQAATLDLSRWTLAFNGAEPVRRQTIDRFAERFAPYGFRREAFYPCYGLAEATLIVSGGLKTAPPVVRCIDVEALENHEVVEALGDEEGTTELVGSGGNLLDQQIRIVDPEKMTPCPANRVGEIWVAGPSVARGYWNRPDATEQTFQAHLQDTGEGPFLRTGDLGFMIDGELFVTGRLKDLIIIRGVNYYPQDIELTAEQSHENLRRNAGAAFTVGEDDDPRLVIVIETERRRDLDTEAIFEAMRRQIAAEHELPVDAIVLIKAGSIPKTSSGKIQRHACRNAFLHGGLKEVARDANEPMLRPDEAARWQDEVAPAIPSAESQASPSSQRTAEIVYSVVREIAKDRAGELTLETNIVELGLDSLERMEIVAALEDTFAGRFPEHVLPEMETCGQVVEAIETYIGTEPRAPSVVGATSELSVDCYQFAEFPEIRQLKQTFELVSRAGLKDPYFKTHESLSDDTTVVNGQELINFSSFNYIGMAGDPAVAQAAKDAIDQFGTSASASRLVSGEKTIHRELEQAIAELIGVDDAIAFIGGHATNETTIGHLFGPGDLVLHDELAHNSIIQGAILSGARRRGFAHNSVEECDRLLKELRPQFRRVVIVVEGVYSMDGDFCDLPAFIELKKRHKTFLMIDEAHSLGAIGAHGRGMSETPGVNPRDVDLWMGTLSKSLGNTGGYIAGCQEVVEYLKYSAPGFVFSVALSPASAAGSLAAIRLLEKEPERVARLVKNSELFLRLAKEQGFNTGDSGGTPVVPVIVGSSLHCLQLSERLFQRGINVQPILHPAVEEHATRLRFFITSLHTEDQIRQAVQAVAEEMQALESETLPTEPVVEAGAE